MKNTVYHCLCLALTAFLAVACGSRDSGEEAADADVAAIVAAQVRQCSRLYTTEYRLHKIVMAETDHKLRGGRFTLNLDFLGDRKIIIPIDATVKGYIDFSNFSESNVRLHDGKLHITLPDPEVMLTSTRVDQQGIRQYVTGLRDNFSDGEMAEIEEQGRRVVIHDIPGLHVEREARHSAFRLLMPLLVQMGYKEEDITITFRHDFLPENLIRKLN